MPGGEDDDGMASVVERLVVLCPLELALYTAPVVKDTALCKFELVLTMMLLGENVLYCDCAELETANE